MAYNYEEGGRYYLPVVVDEVDEDADYPVNVSFLDGSAGDYARIMDKPGLLLKADEINAANIIQAQDNDKARYEELKKRYEGVLNNATEMSDEIKVLKSENERLSKQNEELGAKVAELTTWYNEANKTASEAAEANDVLITKNNELEDANRNLTKACSEWQTAAQAHFKTTEKLREENKKLKQQLDDAEATYSVVADTSIERKSRVTTMEEVIVALVEKIRRLEGEN